MTTWQQAMRDRKRKHAQRRGIPAEERIAKDGPGYCPVCDTWQTQLIRHEEARHKEEMAR